MMTRKRWGISIGIIVLIVLGCLAGYFGYYTKTPQYSLGIVRTAVEKHDWETFSKHVDTDQVASNAFDGLVGYAMDKETDSMAKAFAGGFMALLKPAVVKELTDSMKVYVQTGHAKGEGNGQGTSAAASIDKQANVSNMEFKGIAYTKKDNNLATVGVKLFDKELGKEVILDLKMRELPDGTWQVIQISNLKDYLAEVEKSK